ncbi:MAG: methyltransferase domain-containing protein [Gemmatimonadetes bacterium]|nr:methyltransferase domain-containing protein [Gemmatimonadota bacterium]
MPAAVFDQFAHDYDEHFGGILGRVFRRAVWRWLDAAFQPGEHVLELSCGTGEDALHLAERGVRVLATDASAGMLEVARKKILAEGGGERIQLRRLYIEDLAALKAEFPEGFSGAFSNFGGLNFVADLDATARSLAGLIKPGGRLVLCVVGPSVPWEWVWFLAHGQPFKTFRRWQPGGATWRGVKVYYPTIRRTRRAFGPAFRTVRVGGLGVLLPPPYTESWARRHARLIAMLDRWERRIESWPFVPSLGDHYILELLRT